MLIGNAPCSWGVTYPEGNAVGWQRYLDEVAAAGYRGTELGPYGYFPKDAALLRQELARRDLVLIGATHVHSFSDPASGPALMATLDGLAGLLAGLGAAHLVIMDESNDYAPGREGVLDPAGWDAAMAMIRAAQRMVEGEHGLRLSFHPHVLTCVEYEAQIDRMLEETDITLCFDTGHHAFRDQDALAYMGRVIDRIAYMHLKNVDETARARVRAGTLRPAAAYAAGIMCPLPDGVVDIRAVVALLARHGFAGPVVVEQDLAAEATETPLALARRNLDYLRGIA